MFRSERFLVGNTAKSEPTIYKYVLKRQNVAIFTKFYLSHKYMTLFLYMVLKHKVHKALINIIQLLCRFVNQNYAKNKKRTVLSVL